jgi:hypothetical protein
MEGTNDQGAGIAHRRSDQGVSQDLILLSLIFQRPLYRALEHVIGENLAS